MARCRSCGKRRLAKRRDGLRQCSRCGTYRETLPNNYRVDHAGNLIRTVEMALSWAEFGEFRPMTTKQCAMQCCHE